MTKPPRLTRSEVIDLPVIEASGIATKHVDGAVRIIVVGDRSAQISFGTYGADGLSGWDLVDLSQVEGCPLVDGDSQLEAVAVDGGSLVALMTEDPPVAYVVTSEPPTLHATIELTAPAGSPLERRWADPSSRGEGLVLLRGGRLLVAKEKRPRALIEFSPVGSPSRGLSRDDFLDPDEPWDPPHGAVDFVATAMWRLRGGAKRTLGDISALWVDRDRSLWLLSDKSRCIARLALDEPLSPAGDDIRHVNDVWRLPKGTTKPEGIASLGDGRLLVAMDTRSTVGNGLVLDRPEPT